MFEIEDPAEFDDVDIFEAPPRRGRFARLSEIRAAAGRVFRHPGVFQARWAPAFWTITGSLSLVVNIALLVVLVSLGRELFALKALLSDQLVGGLHDNFVAMDGATIETVVTVEEIIVVEDTIFVNDTIPVVFDLDISQRTNVKLAEDTQVLNAIVNLSTPNLSIFNAPTDILLPKDTILPTRLDLTVPVSQTVPVSLTVPIHLEVPVSLSIPVSIPLNETELHAPFVGLQDVVSPYRELLAAAPESWCEAGWLACWLFGR